MSENRKFALVFILVLLVFSGEKIYRRFSRSEGETGERNYVVKMEKHTYKQSEKPLDINTTNLEEMLAKKVSMSHGKKILEYREITGGFENLEELVRIPGIGKKTAEKLSKKFVLGSPRIPKRVGINTAKDMELMYFGFTKKEIGLIREYHKTQGKIFDNIDLLSILGEKRYEELNGYIEY